MVKIVHFITELSVGGAQTALYRLLGGLNRERYELRVVCLYNGDGRIAQKIRALNIPVYDLGMTGKARLDAFAHLYRYLRRERPSILHTWMFHANIPGRLIGRLAGVPVVISSERTMGQESAARQRLNRWTTSLADRMICVSQTVGDYAVQQIGIPPNKIAVVPNGIDAAQFAHLPDQDTARQRLELPLHIPIVVTVGRPRPVKGYNFLIEAWRQLAAQFPQARLVFVGDGPDRVRLERLARGYGLQDTVSFWGDLDNIPQILPAFDLLALPSLHEGMSNAALEAMAAGLPVVATAVGGTPEIVIHEQTGLLVPPSNPIALADALAALLRDPDWARQMGQAGQERALKLFSHAQTNQLTETIYEALL